MAESIANSDVFMGFGHSHWSFSPQLSALSFRLWSSDGWFLIDLTQLLTYRELIDGVDKGTLLETSGHFFAAANFDDDFSVFTGGQDKTLDWWLIFNEREASETVEGGQALSRAKETAGSDDWVPLNAEKVAGWSRGVFHELAKDHIMHLMQFEWEFAHDAVELFLRDLGFAPQPLRPIAALEGLLAPLSLAKTMVDGRDINGRFERFVIGEGIDFFGIWDRSSAGGPISRYPKTEQGLIKAELAWRKRVKAP